MDITLEELDSFCAELKALNFPQPRQQTFLEVIDLHRIESVSSKLLTFLLNSKAEHGLGHLGLQALFNVLGIKSPKAPETINITPEVRCRLKSNGRLGRMDLVVEVNDTPKKSHRLLVIENKIHHKINNPFDLYIKYCNKKYPNHKKDFILMGLTCPTNMPNGFTFVAHDDFCQALKTLITNSQEEAVKNSHYRHFIFDYIEAMENMSPKKQTPEQLEIISFCHNNLALLDKLQKQRESIRDNFRKKIVEIEPLLKTKIFNKIETDNIDDDNTWAYLGVYAYSNDFQLSNNKYTVYMYPHWALEHVYITLEIYTAGRNQKEIPLSESLTLLKQLKVNVVNTNSDEEIIVFQQSSQTITPKKLAQEIDKLYNKLIA